jgi:hypothetical protein
MKIYRIKKKNEEMYFSSSTRNWDITGTLFITMSRAKRALSYNRSSALKYSLYYSRNSSLPNPYTSRLNDLSNAMIIEYDVVQVKEFTTINGVICEPIKKEETEKSEEETYSIENIDFSSI